METMTAGGADEAPSADGTTDGVAPAGGKGMATPTVPHHRIVRQLGRGGMGAVYLAEQLRPLRRRVALKVVRREMLRPETVARFESERQALAAMDHPNIATILSAGETADGDPYFTMDYVEDGKPITVFCEDAGLPAAGRIELIRQACRAVQHAHQRGVIHRDLSPRNVLVRLQGGEPQVRVIDFGLAKLGVGSEDEVRADAAGEGAVPGGDDDSQTTVGQVLGTRRYMSPEQAAGHAGAADTRSDVYSLGIILLELICGALPSCETGAPAKGTDETISASAAKPASAAFRPYRIAEAVQTAAVRRIAGGDCGRIIIKATAALPDDRYDSPRHLEEDLDRMVAGLPVRATPPTRWYRVRRFCHRHRGGVVAAGLLLGAVTAGIAATLAQAGRADRARAEAELAREEAELAQKKAERAAAAADTASRDAVRLAELNLDLFQQSVVQTQNLIATVPGTAEVRLKLLRQSAQSIREVVDSVRTDDPRVRYLNAVAIRRTAELHFQAGRHRQSLEEARRAAAEASTLAEEGETRVLMEVARASRLRSQAATVMGRAFEAESAADEAVRFGRRAAAEEPKEGGRELALSLRDRAKIRLAIGDAAGCLKSLREAVSAVEPSGIAAVAVYRVVCEAESRGGRPVAAWAAAERAAAEAALFSDARGRPEFRVSANATRSLARVWLNEGEPDVAAAYYRDALTAARQAADAAPGALHRQRDVMIACLALATALEEADRHDEAFARASEGLRLHREIAAKGLRTAYVRNMELSQLLVLLSEIELSRGNDGSSAAHLAGAVRAVEKFPATTRMVGPLRNAGRTHLRDAERLLREGDRTAASASARIATRHCDRYLRILPNDPMLYLAASADLLTAELATDRAVRLKALRSAVRRADRIAELYPRNSRFTELRARARSARFAER